MHKFIPEIKPNGKLIVNYSRNPKDFAVNDEPEYTVKQEPHRGATYPQRRNDRCMCNSDRKFKNCCMKIFSAPSTMTLPTPETEKL